MTDYQGKTYQNHNEISPHLLVWSLSEEQKIPSVDKDVKKPEPCSYYCKNVKWYNREVPQKIKIESSYDLVLLCTGSYLKELKTGCQRDSCTPISIVASLTVAKR